MNRHGIFKKDRRCQCRRNDRSHSLGHRRLRFSFQINDFKDQDRKNRAPLFSAGGRRRRRCSRLGIPCQEVSWKKLLRPSRPGGRRRRLFSRLRFPRQVVLFKKNLSLRPRPGGRRRRLPKEGRSPCQPGFSAISADRKPKPSRPQKTVGRSREASLLYRFRRFDWSAETMWTGPQKQEVFATSVFPWNLGDFRLRGPGGQPVSERGGDIRRRPFRPQAAFFWAGRFSRRLSLDRPLSPAEPLQPAAI